MDEALPAINSWKQKIFHPIRMEARAVNYDSRAQIYNTVSLH